MLTTTGTPEFRGSGFQFPQSQCHPSPRTGIALGTRLSFSRKLYCFTKNLASEVGLTLSDHENRNNRHRLFRNFPRLLRAIECKMAILLVYLSLSYVEKKRRYKRLNMDNATAKLVMRHLHKFHHKERFKVRNSLSIEQETIKLYEYFRIYNIV